MDRFTSAVRKNIESKNWYGALFLALTMPDICGKLAYPEIEFAGQRYKKWFDANLAEVNKANIMGNEVVFLTATDCWALRCSLLHQGTDNITDQRAQEIISKFEFTTMGMHRIKINSVLTLNVASFCEEICQSVENWFNSVSDDTDIQESISKIISIKTEPFSPIPGVQMG
ncbi:hypothetical protein [Ferrimonas pelagia]|uniref:Uncharacterized protein n=1 Tax=Ferrimonas pelagia TaxID=1177826 RepID=A0ABP9EH33_9GAMM